MGVYYLDNIPGDQRLPHDSGIALDPAVLVSHGILYWHIPLPDPMTDVYPEVDAIAHERGYEHRDIINVTKDALGHRYEDALKGFYAEHMHDIEEIRYILKGSEYWDVREYPTNKWIRFTVTAGDFIILPPGVYHRFTLDDTNVIKALRLSKEEFGRAAANKGETTDASQARAEYLNRMAACEALPFSSE